MNLRPAHGFFHVEDEFGRWWRSGRMHWWWKSARTVVHEYGTAEHRHREPVPERSIEIGIEYLHLPAHGHHVSVSGKVSTIGEETLDVHLGVGRLFRWYGKITIERADQFGKERIVRLPPVRIEGQLGPMLVSWCIGENPHSSERDASWQTRLRRNDLRPVRIGWGHVSTVPIVEDDITIPLPEGGAIEARATLSRYTYGIRIGPYSPSRRSKQRFVVTLPWIRKGHIGYNVDIPGGFEGTWGQSAAFNGMLYTSDAPPTRWQNRVVAIMVKSIIDERIRRGGYADQPRRR